MQHVQRLTQELAIHYKRDVGLRSTLCTGNHADTTTAQCAKQFTGDTRRVLHVLAHDSDSGQSAFSVHGEHSARLNLLGKLVVQHLYSIVCILVAHTD